MTIEKEFYPLSESQKSIWYLEKAYPGTSLNIVAGNMRLKGDICYPALEKAFKYVIKKNDSMRLRINETDGTALQYVSEYKDFIVDFIDFSKGGGLKDLFIWDEAKTRTPFDIIEKDLFYCAVYKISDDEGGAYMKLHHLISDAWTIGLATSQIVDFYTKIKNGQPVDESPGPSYIEHLISEAEYEKSGRFEKDKEYWNLKFETLPEMTVLKPQKTGGNSISARRKTLITPLKLSNKIREFCQANNVSVFTLFMSALSIYINRVTGIEDVTLGTTILNRTNVKEKETTGMFVSVAAPVRINVSDTLDFRTFAKAMLKENTDVLRHQRYPYNYLIRDLKKKHKFSNKLFDIVLSYQNSKLLKTNIDSDYITKWIFPGCQVESLIISINDREDSGNLIIDYDFLTDVFDIKEIEFIHQHIISLLWHALDNPTRSISRLEMISEKEKHLILHEFNNTYTEYPRDKTIHQMFEEQVERAPDRTALVFNGREMTYAELNERANRLAYTLRSKGVGPDKIVALLSYRSFEMIVGIMAVLKAGGAYMPIDPGYPAERRRYMLDNSSAVLLLTQQQLLKTIDYTGEIICLDHEEKYAGDGMNLPASSSSGDLAYVIYTSGSTGNPKGVMIQHSGVVNSFCWGVKKFALDADSIVLQKTVPTFDPSVWEIFWWLMLGGKVCLIESGGEKDPEAIISAIEKYKVTTMHFVPSMMNIFLNYVEVTSSVKRLKSLKQVFSCGEAISLNQVEEFNRILYTANGTQLFNMYGPTEATVEVSSFDCSPEVTLNTVPIGKRIDNFSVYILDKNRNILPVGIPGEIYISGAGVSRGYLNNPELTAERFPRNPFVHGEKMYRTGDRARWYPKGDIEFLGRMDFQVKIKGFRIELGEIESKLLEHESIFEAAVKPYTDDGGNTYLAAYIVVKKEISSEEVRRYLSGMLPDYMVPGCIVFLEKMPLNNNGKTDRNALPAPSENHSSTSEYVPPSDETETVLAEIWCRALGLERVGVLDEYSAIGGDSLSAIKIIIEIRKYFGVEVSPRNVFQLQTVRKLAEQIASMNSQENSYPDIPIIPESDSYPVSAGQKRQYILNQIDGGISYNLPGGMVVKGKIDAGRLENVFKTIIRRHESLRTSFEMRDGLPVQIVHPAVSFGVEYQEAEAADDDRLMESFVRPFDLSTAPLLRARLVKLAENRHVLLFDMHHIISDGASINIIIKEFAELYNGGDLPEIKVQYKDYASWHNALLKSEKIKKQEEYWLERFAGELPVLNMPLDFVRPSFPSFKGNKRSFTIDEKLTKGIRELVARTGTTLFMFLLSSYTILLSKYTGQEDIVVGTPVEGRHHADLRELIGMFVNTLAIRSYPAGDKTFEAFLSEVKEDLLNAYDNQEYPFEELVEKAGVKRDMSRNPLFDTVFVLQNMDLTKVSVGGFTAVPYTYNNMTSKFDLTLEAVDKGETIECSFEYCTDLFREETIKRLTGHFSNAIEDMIADPAKKISDIDILSEAERRRLLCDFNDTEADYPRDKTIHSIFEEQAAKTPDNIALVFQDRKMAYGALNERANRLGNTLRAYGVGPDDIVGIIIDRSFEMIVAIMAVLKAGGAYMPIDPDYPAERKAYMLEDSGAKVLVTSRAYLSGISFAGTVIDLYDEESYAPDTSNLEVISKPSDLAYIIYTSGSTGRPKGVMIEHRNVVRLMFNDKFQFDFNDRDVWTLFHSYCFDFSVWEMYGALLYGGKLIVIPKEAAADTRRFLSILQSENVTVLNQTPSAFYNLINEDACSQAMIPSLRYVIFGGEALKPPMLRSFKAKYPDTKLINMYGITETTVHVTFKEISLADTERNISNVGLPIPTLKVFILDRHMKLLPVGVPGEIYVGGDGVARGYLNREMLTREKFVRIRHVDDSTLYRSGDLGRRLPDGDIEYLGRIDSQVKIRGYRIELGELENELLRHSDIEETVITVYETSAGDKKLCAYFKSKAELSSKDLSSYLTCSLPNYMIPSYFVRVDAFPLNKNGKIDKSRLPKPYEALPQSEIVQPRNISEEIMVSAWSEVLDIPAISIDDNFFDIGGDSLSAIRVVSMLKLRINLIDFYTNPTVRLLTEKIKNDPAKTNALVKLTRGNRTADRNIICFPYGGGSALAYREFNNSQQKKALNINVYSVNLPGHDYGLHDELVPLEQFAKKLADEIAQNLSGELILYSHCVGCALLLATIDLLEKACIPVKAVFIGGIMMPRFIRFYGRIVNPWTFYSDKRIIKYLKKIGLPSDLTADNEYVTYIVRAFKYDARCFTRYMYSRLSGKRNKQKIPMYVVVGDKDVTTKSYLKRYTQWYEFFNDIELIVIENADHYFLYSHADKIVEYIDSL